MVEEDKEVAEHDKYGVVIDAGSSGSRVYVYKWIDPTFLSKETSDESVLHSVPEIRTQKDWTKRIEPGLSSFSKKPERAYKKHIKILLEHAEHIIPEHKHRETPVFIQSTAGMRLLSDRDQKRITDELCRKIRDETHFLLENCAAQIETIDGETEGIYGWLSLNYLKKYFDRYDGKLADHSSHGFLDMGGGSLQIAFKPSDPEEIKKHKEDISTITLKSVNGDAQRWDVFTSTWLRFGTREVRKRYLNQLVNTALAGTGEKNPKSLKERTVYDPCLPKGSEHSFTYSGADLRIRGMGNYEQCSKTIYPLLLKNSPCPEQPCSFSGIHMPKIDFTRDSFLGVSEYTYTINDVFHMDTEYNFSGFSEKVQQFCELDWQNILHEREDGKYGDISKSSLREVCFKANWVINVLHEGFGIPRKGIDPPSTGPGDVGNHITFSSADNVNGYELTWTLGKILLYACSMVQLGENARVGLQPSELSVKNDGKKFIPGEIPHELGYGSTTLNFFHSLVQIVIIFAVGLLLYWLYVKLHIKQHLNINSIKSTINCVKGKLNKIRYSKVITSDQLEQLEAGVLPMSRFGGDRDGFKFRSRTMLNLSSQGFEDYPVPGGRASGAASPALSDNAMGTIFSMADFSDFNRPKP
ncbi:AaceriADR006Wp [[Ashbya] aceris (nom. inval.)]|nr:AaceriADR006Wp [[Ashbya] aceris (nom. inval.)]